MPSDRLDKCILRSCQSDVFSNCKQVIVVQSSLLLKQQEKRQAISWEKMIGSVTQQVSCRVGLDTLLPVLLPLGNEKSLHGLQLGWAFHWSVSSASIQLYWLVSFLHWICGFFDPKFKLFAQFSSGNMCLSHRSVYKYNRRKTSLHDALLRQNQPAEVDPFISESQSESSMLKTERHSAWPRKKLGSTVAGREQ